MLNDILAPLSPEEFFRDYWTRQFLHIPGPIDKFSRFFPWEVLNKALEEHRFDAKRLVLWRAGRKIEPDRYLNSCWVDSRGLVNELLNGSTLIFNSCEEVYPPLTDLCVFLWKPTRPHPLRNDVVNTVQAPSDEPVWDGTLEAGELLSIPRGWWHVAYPVDEPSLHLTVTMSSPTGIDFLHWLADQMKSSDAARMDVPIMAAAAERASWLEKVRTDWLAAWDKDPISLYLAGLDAKTPSRPRISLPAEAESRRDPFSRTTLLELSDRRPLEFSAQDGRTIGQAGGFRWHMDAGVAEKLRRFNDGHPHSIAELSPVPDFALQLWQECW